jgi:hypothetical protein
VVNVHVYPAVACHCAIKNWGCQSATTQQSQSVIQRDILG